MKTIKFLVASDPGLYGTEATPQDVQEYATFAHQHLSKKGYDEVQIEFTTGYTGPDADAQAPLRKEIWDAFRGGR